MLEQRTDDDRYLGETFKFLVARWIFVVGIVFFGIGSSSARRWAAWSSSWSTRRETILFTLFPEQVNRLFPGGKT